MEGKTKIENQTVYPVMIILGRGIILSLFVRIRKLIFLVELKSKK